MSWRVIMLLEAKLELKHEAEVYGERLVDEVEAVSEWLRKMPLRYQQWPTDPVYRRAVGCSLVRPDGDADRAS